MTAMMAWKRSSFGQDSDGLESELSDVASGMVAGTRVATPSGWRDVAAIAVGDQVLTFDGGMQSVVAVQRQVVWTSDPRVSEARRPLSVPPGALGNRGVMVLLAQQSVLIESDTAEQVFGDPFALIPAAALNGFRGIAPADAPARIEVVSLHFSRDEVVFANVGALFLCPRAGDLLADLFDDAESPYTVLPRDAADLLVGFLEIEDTGQVPVRRAAAAFGVAA
jgi:hypothetical protein